MNGSKKKSQEKSEKTKQNPATITDECFIRYRIAFDKIQHHFMLKILKELRIEGIFLNLIKSIYGKPSGNVILNDKRTIFPLSQEKDMISVLVISIQHYKREIMTRQIRHYNEIVNWIKIKKYNYFYSQIICFL